VPSLLIDFVVSQLRLFHQEFNDKESLVVAVKFHYAGIGMATRFLARKIGFGSDH
jgi:hypothetical protein